MKTLGLIAALFLPAGQWSGAGDEQALLAAYRTAPQGYPKGRDDRGVPFAQPDTDAFFRWHFFHEGVPRAESASMKAHVQPYNPLEGEGVDLPEKHVASFRFVDEHVTEGKKALRLDFDAAALDAGRAAVRIEEVVGPSYMPGYDPKNHHVAAFLCHYRWLKFDVFVPGEKPVRLTVNRVPLVVPAGASVVAVKTPDLMGWTNHKCAFVRWITLRPAPGSGAVTLFVDNVRSEQEVPRTLSEKGRLFMFPARTHEQGKVGPPILWPGFTAVERDTLYDAARGFGWTRPAAQGKRVHWGHTFRSVDNGFLWGGVGNPDGPFRVDLPKGRYGVWFMPFRAAGWGELEPAVEAVTLKINGTSYQVRSELKGEDRHRHLWAGEAWDWRPGSSLWQELVWPLCSGKDPVHYVDNTEGSLEIEMPWARALILFPEADKEAALQEIERFKFLLAESWDVSHAWVRGPYARDKDYLGAHEEAWAPEVIPAKVKALALKGEDYRRGFALFRSGLTEPLYPDSIPAPDDLTPGSLEAVAVPGMSDCVTFGILPLGRIDGVKVEASLPGATLDVRLGRYHHKTMEEGHHNHGYAIMEHYLVRRPTLTLHPGAARRVYVDVGVAADAKPGVLTGRVVVSGPHGQRELPLRLIVADVKLGPAPFAVVGEKRHPVLDRYGFSASIEEFKSGLPPVYSMLNLNCFSHEWQQGRKIPNGGATPEVLERHRQAGEPFWIADQLLHAKEHAARFTYGVWLWRTGATGRLTAIGLGNTGQRGRNAYHTHASGCSGNVYRAVIDSLVPGEHNPSRDLLLMRQGIDDARLFHALDEALRNASPGEIATSARAFRNALWAEIELDLNSYYRLRTGSYAEDMFVKPGNPWTSAKFSAVRKACVEYLQALAR